jgi:HK97 family phage major capsid protein
MTNQPNMADLARDLRQITNHLPKMQAAAAKVADLEKRLDGVENTASLAYSASKAVQGSALESFAASTRSRGMTDPHSRAFQNWLRSPQDNNRQGDLLSAEMDVRAEGSTLTGASGGFSVPEPVADQINQRILEISPMRGLASVFQVTSTGTKFLVNRNNATSGWVGETDPRTATGEPTLDLRVPTFGTAHGLIEATEELVLDSALDVTQWFIGAASQKIAAAEGQAFVSGNGTDKPTGFLAGPTPLATGDSTRAAGTLQFVPSGDAAAITLDSLNDLFFAMKAQHRAQSTWLMSSATGAALSKIRDSDGRSIWQHV